MRSDTIHTDLLTPESFQVSIIDAVKSHNTVACVNSDLHIDFLLVTLLREFNIDDRKSKIIICEQDDIARIVALVSLHTNLRCSNLQPKFNGYNLESDSIVDVYVLTSGQVLEAVQSSHFIFEHGRNNVNLIIFTGCENVLLEDEDSTEMIMSLYTNRTRATGDIRIAAITSKLMDSKVTSSRDLKTKLHCLCNIFRANIEICRDMIQSDIYGIKPNVIDITYEENYKDQDYAMKMMLKEWIIPMMEFFEESISRSNGSNNEHIIYERKSLQTLKECTRILDDLGIWGGGRVAESMANRLQQEMGKLKPLTDDNKERIPFMATSNCLNRVYKTTDRVFNKEVVNTEDFHKMISKKAKKLLEIFKAYKPTEDFSISAAYENSCETEEDDNKNSKDKPTRDCQKDSDSSPPMCALVFVKHRHTAQTLSNLIEQITIFDEDLFHVKSRHLHGGTTKESYAKREATLNMFRQRQINLLFITFDYKEKLDLPRCNLVINFDAPTSPISYIQTKSYARVQHSNFYSFILISDNESIRNIKEFQNIEKMLSKKTLNYFDPSTDVSPMNNEAPLIDEATLAMLELDQAIAVINRYCQRLPSDSFTHLTATVQYHPFSNASVVAEIHLPLNSAVKKPVKGIACESRLGALRSASLKVCSQLHYLKELDEYFAPMGKDIIKYEDIDNEWLDFEQVGGAKPGSTTRKVYPKRISKSLIQSPGYTVYVYEILIKLEQEASDFQNSRNRKTYHPELYNRSFAILSTKKLPPIPVFPLFIRAGEVSIEIRELCNNYTLEQEQLNSLVRFHRFLFKSILKLEKKSLVFSPDNAVSSFLISPTIRENNHLGIDWDFISEIEMLSRSSDKIVATTYTSMPHMNSTGKTFTFEDKTFMDAVVSPCYRNMESPQYFYVAEIREDLSPKSPFPSKDNNSVGISYDTFADYYQTKYNTCITNPDQPLIDVDHTNARLNLLTPRYTNHKGHVFTSVTGGPQPVDVVKGEGDSTRDLKTSSGEGAGPSEGAGPNETASSRKSRQVRDDQKQLLVPELCRVHVMPASLWRKAVCLPAILYRINYLLVAGELRDRIGCKAGAGCKKLPEDFKFERMTIMYPNNNNRAGSQFTFKHVNDGKVNEFLGPSSFNVLQALTMSCSNDFFNLERLETIGDSFLKFAITLYLYEENTNTHEGRLSYMRSKYVSNYNLYAKGKDKHLPVYMISSKFEPGDNWMPPCYKPIDTSIAVKKPDNSIDTEVSVKDLQKNSNVLTVPQIEHYIADKSIADCVESLIGCYLINGGEKAAVRFINWVLNLKKKINNYSITQYGYTDSLLIGLEEFEDIIQYKFNDKQLLLQSLTHPSYKYNKDTDCYQRLEFLGDAILDYMITRHVFEDKAMYNPGILTDMRSALVNNNLFASLAVKWNFHKFMKSLSAPQFKVIDLFILNKYTDPDIVKDTESNYADSMENEIEHPKALADLFEALAGAVYLDCEKDLDVVWKVFKRLMQPQLDAVAMKIPMSPVRELLEMEPDTVKFEKPEKMEDGRIRVSVKVIGKDTYQGMGRNYKIAKCAAAMQALKYIKVGNLKATALQMNTTAIHNAMFA